MPQADTRAFPDPLGFDASHGFASVGLHGKANIDHGHPATIAENSMRRLIGVTSCSTGDEEKFGMTNRHFSAV
jgi:hypothetical protein